MFYDSYSFFLNLEKKLYLKVIFTNATLHKLYFAIIITMQMWTWESTQYDFKGHMAIRLLCNDRRIQRIKAVGRKATH